MQKRYSATCHEDAVLVLVAARSSLVSALASRMVGLLRRSRAMSGSSSCTSACSSLDTRPPSPPVALFFKLRASTLSAHCDENAKPLFRASVLALLATEDPLMRMTVKLGDWRHIDTDDSDAGPGGTPVVGFEKLAKGSWITVEAHDSPTYFRWKSALAEAGCSSFQKFYKRGPAIGKGHFSNVYLATDRQTGEVFAVKVIKGDKNNPEKSQKYVRREVKVLSVTDHENLIKACDLFMNDGKPHIVLEYIPNGSLKDLVVSMSKLSEGRARPIMTGILRGVAYLHSKGIIHRDIKPENVLMAGPGLPKITDFGLSVFLKNEGDQMHSVVGTPAYCSPEVCLGIPYGPPADAWACGVLFYYMLSGERPFQGQTRAELKAAIVRGTFDFPNKSFRNVGRKAKALISMLLVLDQTQRCTVAQALSHEWFDEL